MRDAQILYLHGLASSPQSVKARFFVERLAARHRSTVLPDLNEGDFRHLTTSRAVALACGLLDEMGSPVVVFGSSFGGRVAALTSQRRPEQVAGLVLMAPAFAIDGVWRSTLGADGLARWREEGELRLDHPAYSEAVGLAYGFYEDALLTGGIPTLSPALPVLVFHGRHDDVVPLADSERFAEHHPEARLIALDADHALTGQGERMWREVEPFVARLL